MLWLFIFFYTVAYLKCRPSYKHIPNIFSRYKLIINNLCLIRQAQYNNTSFRTSILPKDFKQAVKCPLYFIQGNKMEIGNYRPIALASTLPKVFKKRKL